MCIRDSHNGACVKKGDISTYSGNCYLGIDAGSTTTKVALVAEDGTLLYSFYSSNNGSPLATSIIAIKEIYEQLPKDAHIVSSCSTGYGEALVKAALMLDEGEVETVAHYTAAAFFDPKVDCILDIGGQDMKCIKIKNNTVDSVQFCLLYTSFKISSDEELGNFFANKWDDTVYIMEEFINAEINSYDAIIDSHGNPIFEAGNVTPMSIMDIVNNADNALFYICLLYTSRCV